MKTKTFTASDVDDIAKLANIPVTPEEKASLAQGFNTVIGVLDTLKNVDTKNIQSIEQVIGLTNVLREDEVDVSRMFTQDEALSNAPKTKNGFFIVERVLDET